MNNLLEKARKVLSLEADALVSLATKLDNSFEEAVNLILSTKGRVIVIGIGKSGHICRKIAATFASTGTPAFFAHPSELTHGDLGMITSQDICLIISNSGETQETIQIIPHLNRRNIPIIGISSNPSSTLARLSRVHIDLYVENEACFLNMAPTTSTTASLAIGDALAVVVMEEKNFSKEDFIEFHPGGSLGKTLIKVKDLMRSDTTNLPILSPDASFVELLELITEKKLGFCCITDLNQKLVNIFTDGDLRRLQLQYRESVYKKNLTQLLEGKHYPLIIDEDSMAFSALATMNEHNVTNLVVTDDHNNIKGIITIQDILKGLG